MSAQNSTNSSPTRYNQGGNPNTQKKNHPFITSGLFDVLSQIETEINGQYGFCECMTTIVVTNRDTDELLECAIKGAAYIGPDLILNDGTIYYLKGRILALNHDDLQVFYYEAENSIPVSPSESFRTELANKVSVTGLGIISSREVENVSPGKDNIIIVVEHSDFNPAIRDQDTFQVEYRCNWSPLMAKLQSLLVPRREALLTGRITGYIPSRNMWSVEVSGVNITTGHESGQQSSLPSTGSSLGTPGGRTRGKLFVPGGTGKKAAASPSIVGDSIGEVDEGISSTGPKGKGKATVTASTSRGAAKRTKVNGSDAE
ncbi:uncharacterized protein MELLADRAFT_58374 [Melampsora larici-populina 98AG31]|uniref:Uncharacterized protein n=1 Tax=Melampsora larici-populina (strain 98AG31 / pathotype 3-4-7) TaxID=747676 RepID=F4R394_MELLP|nr:uncharacterized protein MELLADRAFT_58374 [Melampsora larici-populina 98AG31]EGG13208.1 hypothetical protein MELLADRAFT_58374 [Melampsora larici-populina 98AG31]